MTLEAGDLVIELQSALDLHDRTYPDGDWKGANERIQLARIKTDEFIFNQTGRCITGRWSNDQILKFLGEN